MDSRGSDFEREPKSNDRGYREKTGTVKCLFAIVDVAEGVSTAIDAVSVVLSGLVTLIFAFIGSYVMWKVIGPRVVTKAIQDRLGPILQAWLVTPVPTGRTKVVINADGEEETVEQAVSPLDQMMTAAGEILYRKMLGKIGGDRRKVGAVQDDITESLANPSSPLGALLGQVNPKLLERAIRDRDYVPIILDQFGPVITQWLEKKLSNPSTMTGQF